MTTLSGQYFAHGSSRRHRVQMQVQHDRFELRLEDGGGVRHGLLTELVISDRIGNTPRRVNFADGSVFETTDNEAVDAVLVPGHDDADSSRLHRLESRWSLALAGVLVVGGLLWFAAFYGIPTASRFLAYQVPAAATGPMSSQTLAVMDEVMLEPSTLTAPEQQRLQQRFDELLLMIGPSDFRYRLHFRGWPETPNAFALPSGDVVLTDELLALAKNPLEVDSVLLHEIGHVENRHALQGVISGAIIAMGAAFITGDIAGADALVTGLPAFMAQQRYSRANEAESDQFAFELMLGNDRDPRCFATMMSRLDATVGTESPGAADKQTATISHYFESHPATLKRIEAATRAAEGFRGSPQCPMD